MTKRFLDEEDLSEIQRGISAAQNVANNASETVKQVSNVAQGAAELAEEAAENALSAYSPTNKPTPDDIGALPKTGGLLATGTQSILRLKNTNSGGGSRMIFANADGDLGAIGASANHDELRRYDETLENSYAIYDESNITFGTEPLADGAPLKKGHIYLQIEA